MQSDGQVKRATGKVLLYIDSNSGPYNKIGVAGYRFLSEIADEV